MTFPLNDIIDTKWKKIAIGKKKKWISRESIELEWSEDKTLWKRYLCELTEVANDLDKVERFSRITVTGK